MHGGNKPKWGTEESPSKSGEHERSLKKALWLTGTFLIIEVIGGVVTQSLALISDAAHMGTDTTALIIALMAIRLGKRPPDLNRTFGYHRSEILAATFNAMLLFGVAIYILYEAYLRISAPPEVKSIGMLIIATAGMVINLISMRLLSKGQEQSLNVKGAYLEVWADLIGSIGVILGAIAIMITGWAWIDSAVAVLVGFWVIPRTWSLLKSSINVLLEGVPENISLQKLKADIEALADVQSVHDLHVWSVTTDQVTLTVHLVVTPGVNHEVSVLPALREMLDRKYGIFHVTAQCETTPCDQALKVAF